MPSLLASVHSVASYLKRRGMALADVQSSQYCSACGKGVPGFYFYSYRAYGCPHCRSSPRERLVHWAFDQGRLPPIRAGARILHVAPSERRLVQRFQSNGTDYVAVDLDPGRYPHVQTQRADLTRSRWDEPFDLIYASHVLEHIPDDRAAMRNVREHLVLGGAALFLVPLRGETTEDGPADLSARERTRRFGQWDHVRQYGMDIVDRLRESGFDVVVVDAAAAGPAEMARLGFETRNQRGDPETEKVFVCTRREG